MVSVKKLTIFFSVFFSKRVLEIMFSYGLERKEAFEDDKNVNFLSPIFSSLFFSKIVLEVMFSYGLERKEAFEDDKNVHFF